MQVACLLGAYPFREVGSRNLLTFCPEERDIVCTEYEVMEDVFLHKQARGESTEDIERYLATADKETKYIVHCINIDNFLKRMCSRKVSQETW